MFYHHFKYALKTLLKNKMLLFWTLAFPIILGTLFHMAFSDIEKSEQLSTMSIAIIETEEWKENKTFQNAMESLSKEDKKLFHIKYVTEEKAKALLEENKIIGYLQLKDTPKVIVKKNGMNETIFKYVIEEISQTESMIENIYASFIKEKNESLEDVLSNISTNIYEKVQNDKAENYIQNISNANLSYTMIEFYTLIAMTCLYGGILGMTAINQNLANMSSNGKRVEVSPLSKGKLVLGSVMASYLIQIVGLALLIFYTIFVLNVDYGSHIGLMIILAFIGSLAGLSLGVLIACLLQTNDNVKTGVIISITMLGCFLSGMMGISMKYMIDKNIPIINKINPASMITDGFYALYYYDTLDRYYFNIGSLLLFAFIMIGVSIWSLRRQQYDHI